MSILINILFSVSGKFNALTLYLHGDPLPAVCQAFHSATFSRGPLNSQFRFDPSLFFPSLLSRPRASWFPTLKKKDHFHSYKLGKIHDRNVVVSRKILAKAGRRIGWPVDGKLIENPDVHNRCSNAGHAVSISLNRSSSTGHSSL